MNRVLIQLFIENGFESGSGSEQISFYGKQDANLRPEYFLVEIISAEQFLERSSPYEKAVEVFEESKVHRPDIEKNTSWILAVRVSELKDGLLALKNKILKVEEDTFWFKKYVIVFTDSGIMDLTSSGNLLADLNSILLNQELFRVFKEDMYANELYMIVVQLFIKLPFLTIPIESNNELRSINDILSGMLASTEMTLFRQLLQIGNLENSTNWNEIRELALKQDSNDAAINDFLSKFNLDA